MTKTRVPAIPAPTEANLREVARALKVLADIREGVTGDPLDRFVTFRDLDDGGVASVSLSGGRVSGIRPSAPIAGPGYDPTADLTTPPQPTGVTATGAFASVILSWDGPPAGYINHAYAEIWRADTNVIGESILIGTTSSTRFVDFIGNSATRYYWVRFVSQANVIGAYHGISGAVGTTSEDPELLLDALTGQITENQLYQDLGARINLIDGSGVGSVNARIADESYARSLADATLTSAVQAEEAARSLADGITGAALAAAGMQAGQTAAALIAESSTRIDGDVAVATIASGAVAQAAGAVAAITLEQQARTAADEASAQQVASLASALGDGAAALQVEQGTRADADQAVASRADTLAAAAGQTSAALQTVSTTQASADSALASQVTTLQSTVGGNTVAIETEALTRASETGGLFAKYGIKIDNAGHVSGFGLLSTNNDATPTSEFGIRADKFWIAGASTASSTEPTTDLYKGRVWLDTSVTPNVTRYYTGSAWSTTPQTLPFSVLAAPGTINGVSVPAGVYIDTAFIGNATIKSAQIGSVAADTIQAGYTSSVDLESSTFFGSQLYIGGTATYEFNDPTDNTRKTGIASVANPNIALSSDGAEFNVDFFKIKNGNSFVAPFEVVDNTVRIKTTTIGDGTITNAKIGNILKSSNFDGIFNEAGAITGNGTVGWAISKAGQMVLDDLVVRSAKSASAVDNAIGSSAGNYEPAVSSITLEVEFANITTKGFVVSCGMNGHLSLYLNTTADRVVWVQVEMRAYRSSDGLVRQGSKTLDIKTVGGGLLHTPNGTYLTVIPISLNWLFQGEYWVYSQTRPPGTVGIPPSPYLVSGALPAGTWSFRAEVFAATRSPGGNSAQASISNMRFSQGGWAMEHQGVLPTVQPPENNPYY